MTDRNGQDPAATDNGCALKGNKKIKGYQKGKRGKYGH